MVLCFQIERHQILREALSFEGLLDLLPLTSPLQPTRPPTLSHLFSEKNSKTWALPFRGNESTFLCFLGGISCMTKSKVEHTCIVKMQKIVIHFHSFQFQ